MERAGRSRLYAALAFVRRTCGRLAQAAEPAFEFLWALRRATSAPGPVFGADFMRTELLLTCVRGGGFRGWRFFVRAIVR